RAARKPLRTVRRADAGTWKSPRARPYTSGESAQRTPKAMNENNRNMILAVVLSMLVLFGWQFFIAGPQLEKAQREAELAATQQTAQEAADLAAPTVDGAAAAPTGDTAVYATREQALAATDRVAITTGSLSGSISLVGARIDDLHLLHYTETPDPESPTITLLSPAGSPQPYYLEQGWLAA